MNLFLFYSFILQFFIKSIKRASSSSVAYRLLVSFLSSGRDSFLQVENLRETIETNPPRCVKMAQGTARVVDKEAKRSKPNTGKNMSIAGPMHMLHLCPPIKIAQHLRFHGGTGGKGGHTAALLLSISYSMR